MTVDRDTLEQDVAEYLQQQFEAFQLAEEQQHGSNNSNGKIAWSKAASILKHIQVMALNAGIAQSELTGNVEDEDEDSTTCTLSSFISPLLLRFVDASMAVEVDDDAVTTRVFDLVSALACSLAISGDKILVVVESVLERTEEWSEVLIDRIRSQACVLMMSLSTQLGGLLRRHLKKNKGEHGDGFTTKISALFESMEGALMNRLTDKIQSVRHAAIQSVGGLLAASSCIQPKKTASTKKAREESENSDKEDSDSDEEEDEADEEEENSPALDGLLWSMWHDPSIANRIEAIEAVPITVDTVDHIVARIHDVKEKVRLAALDALCAKVDPRVHMTEEHFCDIIQNGLTERCEATKAATLKLMCTKWMKVAKFDPVELLRLMSATVNDQESEKALKVILQTVRSGDHSPMQELSDPEIRSFCASMEKSMIQLKDANVVFDEYQLFYTRVACSTAKESTDMTYTQKEELLAKAAPDIPTLCDLFQRHLQTFMESVQEEDEESQDQECFVCLQLLQLAKVAGLQEEGSRRHFAGVLAKVLSNIETPEDLIEESVEALRAAYEDDENEFFNAISVVLAGLTAEQDGDFVMDDEKIADTNLRVLFIFSVILENATSALSSHELLDNMVKIILSAVSSSTKSIREVGISCFGKVGLFSKEETVLKEFKPILLKIMSNDKEALQCRGQALLALADWSLLYSDILKTDESDEAVNLLDSVHKMMQNRNDSIVAISAEVAAKLLFTGRVSDTRLLGRLLTCFLDPNRQKESRNDDGEGDDKAVGSQLRLQQLLSIFFPAFCYKSKESRQFLLNSIKPALEVAAGISKTAKRPLLFPLIKIVDYVCSVVEQTAPEMKENEEEDNQGNILDVTVSSSLQVAQFLVKQEEKLSVTQRRTLCKFLGAQDIDISQDDKKSLLKLKGYMSDLEFVADASSAKSLKPLNELLQHVDGEVDDEDEEESVPNENTVDAEEVSETNNVSDDETVTEQSDEEEEASVDESTGDVSVMDSLAALATSKENARNSVSSKRSTRTRRSSGQSSASILESLGTPIKSRRSSAQSSVNILESLGSQSN
ncbi:MAG: hypothetical protein SGILL_001167 [Bacillariaceae sp.]